MSDPRSDARAMGSDADLLARLATHRTVGNVPRAELEWLVAHGTIERWAAGQVVVRAGEPVGGLYFILEGRVSHFSDQGGTWRKVMDWRGGEVTGQLPYSRMTTAPGNSVVDEPTEALCIPRACLAEMPMAVPHVTEALVHVMLDRARTFKMSDLQLEKMASLGKLAAGLAHELNNPASAAMRGAQEVSKALTESDDAARALGAAHLDARELSVIDRIRSACLAATATCVLSPLERSDREDSIAEWLAGHDIDDVDELDTSSLADTGMTVDTLNELAAALAGEKLRASLRWVAAESTIRTLARDIERAASRMAALVSAVKGLTYMDRATVPEPVDLVKGLTDMLSVLGSKARSKSASLSIDVPENLPRVRAFGGELNQVWVNLVDNALDAVSDGGRVTVTVRANDATVEVRVIDDGPGIPGELRRQIFDPFFTTKPVGQGTGLGLDIVRHLVDRNEGRIDVESEPGRTEFRVTLRVAQ